MSDHQVSTAGNALPWSVRVLTPDDAAAYRTMRIAALRDEASAFGSLPEDEPDLATTVERLAPSDDRRFLGAFVDRELVGIVRLSRYESPNEKHRAYLAGLYVLPHFRRRGYGMALVREALHQAAGIPGLRRINLAVVTTQAAAIRLYHSLGFRIYGTDPETFSRDGCFYDEHLMTLEIARS